MIPRNAVAPRLRLALALSLAVLAACGERGAKPAPASEPVPVAAAPEAPPPAIDTAPKSAPGARAKTRAAATRAAAAPALDISGLAPSTPPPARPVRVAASPLCANPGTGPEPDGAQLQSFVGGRIRGIRDCYEKALKRDATLRGRVVVRFTIGTCGEVSDLELARSRNAAPDLSECVTRVVRTWRTPFRPSEPVAVEYPFNFTAG